MKVGAHDGGEGKAPRLKKPGDLPRLSHRWPSPDAPPPPPPLPLPTMKPSSSKQNSRFSTLNVFKLAGAGGSAKPPRPPPKDSYHQSNSSALSLSTSSSLAAPYPSAPATPIFSGGARAPSPAPSRSTTASSLAPDTVPSTSSRKGFRLGFGRSKSKSPHTPPQELLQQHTQSRYPPPQEDEGISMPWNFQVGTGSFPMNKCLHSNSVAAPCTC